MMVNGDGDESTRYSGTQQADNVRSFGQDVLFKATSEWLVPPPPPPPIYIYIHTHTYIYIYGERERDTHTHTHTHISALLPTKPCSTSVRTDLRSFCLMMTEKLIEF